MVNNTPGSRVGRYVRAIGVAAALILIVAAGFLGFVAAFGTGNPENPPVVVGSSTNPAVPELPELSTVAIPEPPAAPVTSPATPSELEVYGMILPLDGWKVFHETGYMTYVDSQDPDMACHDLQHCPHIRILKEEPMDTADKFADNYAECTGDAKVVFMERMEIDGERAFRYLINNCDWAAYQNGLSNAHTLIVFPDRGVVVVYVEFGGKLDFESALQNIRWM